MLEDHVDLLPHLAGRMARMYKSHLYKERIVLAKWIKHLPLDPKVMGSNPISCYVEKEGSGEIEADIKGKYFEN